MREQSNRMGFAAFFLFCALCANSVLNVDSRDLQTLDGIEKDNYVFQKYFEMDKHLKEFVNRGIKIALPYIMEGSEHVNLSSSCSRDIFKLISDIRKLKLSAFKLLDAISKISDGVLTGNVVFLGDYDQCLDTTVTQNDGNIAFKGEYCMIQAKPLFPSLQQPVLLHTGLKGLIEATKNTSEIMQYIASKAHFFYRVSAKFGVCVPSGCSSEDIDSIVKYIGEKVGINAGVAYCDQHYDNPISTGKIIAIFSFSLFGLLTIIGTSTDYYARRKDVTFQNQMARFVLCFSVLTNFPKVFSAKMSEKSLSSIFGIRTLSVFYVILLHHYFFKEKFAVEGNMLNYENDLNTFFKQIVTNGFLTTEVFFFIGGLVHSYSVMKAMENRKQKISCVTKIVHRLLRIYPPYLFCMLTVYILRNSHGPLKTLVKQQFWDNCDKNWWLNLLFINNFFMQEETCLFHSWYIAADMHLFLISVFTVPVFLRNPKKGVLLHLGIVVIGLISTALWAWHKNILPSLIVTHIRPEEINQVWNAYCTTFPHIAPYFTGLLIGYVLSTYKDFKIPLVYRLIGWPVASVAFLSMLFVTQRWNSGIEPTVLESVLYFSFSRLIYVLAVSWLVVCCARGYGGILNYILSLNVWVPISRLSFMMFLLSPIIQVAYIANVRMIIDNSNTTVIWQYIGDLGISFLMALAMTTVIESPFVAIEKIIFKRKPTEGTKNTGNYNEDQVISISNEKGQIAIELENNIKNTTLDMQSRQ